MKKEKVMKTQYVCRLSEELQKSIREDLENCGQNLTQQEIEMGMSSRLCDLEEAIDISKYVD